jgi:hypothetical protein
MSSLIIIVAGILTGIIFSVLYYKFFIKSDNYQKQNKKNQNIRDYKDVPELSDSESKLIKCQNCGCLNGSDYYVCRICTSDLYNREIVEKKDLDNSTNTY